jgi:hypothetical protein
VEISNKLKWKRVIQMKRIARFSFFYCILGMLLGVFYREFTKIKLHGGADKKLD